MTKVTKMEEFTIAMDSGRLQKVMGRRLSANFFMHPDPVTDQNSISHIGSGLAVPSAHPKNVKNAKALADDLEKVCDWSKVTRDKRGVVNKKIYQKKVKKIRALFVEHGVPAYVLST